ncbi:MAG: C1 family peptidase [Bacteroidales bacterium]|nr:C1 family peptidase [Bacteroidales bacterium]
MKLLKTSLAAIALLSATALSAQQKPAPEFDLQFTTVKENPITPVKNQYRSGTCWCFSGLGFLESEILRETGKEVDLSEMWIVGHSYRDRAIKYVRLDGHLGLSAGSSTTDVLETIKEYGIVPQSAFSGMNYGTELPVQGELDGAIKAYTDAIVKNPNKTLTTAWIKGVEGIIEAYLGEYPESFEVDGVTYTPESYLASLKINLDDYVHLSSFSHKSFYEPHVIEVCDNWRWSEAYNVPIEDFMAVIDNAIDNGYTLAWGTDVSEKGFTRDGYGLVLDEQAKVTTGSDQEHWVGKAEEKPTEASANYPVEIAEVTDSLRQDAYDRKMTTDDHGMQIYGIAKDQSGKKFCMIKNSWGETGKFKGLWYCSENFVKFKSLDITVHKDALPKDLKKKLGIK